MPSKFKKFIEVTLVMAVISAIFFIYTNYFMVTNPDGSSSFSANGNPGSFLVFIAVSFICVFGIVAAIIISFHKWWNRRASEKTTSCLAGDLSRLYLEEDFLEQVRRFGIEINNNSLLIIKPEILARCSLKQLAHLVTLFFYKNFPADLDWTKVFYSLANLLLETWSEEETQKFADLIYQESITLGEYLRYALEHQKISREVKAFNQGISQRLEALEQLHLKRTLSTTGTIAQEFTYHDYLLDGHSAVVNWLLKKIKVWSFGLVNPVVVG